MRYAVLLGIEKVAEDDGPMHALSYAEEASAAHPKRIVRVFDTYTDELVHAMRNGEVIDGE